MGDLSSRTAVVTGAGSGIGAAVAHALFAANARLALVARTEPNVQQVARTLDATGKRVSAHVVDVGDEAALVRTRDEILERTGSLDILVTCAAAPAAAGPSEELTLEAWRGMLATDLDGVFLCCKTFAKPMIAQRYGRIVNLTSFHTIATYPRRAAYNAAKSGVEGLTRALAVEWGPCGITVNAVAPGPIRTPRTSWFLERDPAAERGMLGRTPTKRIGEPADVAALIAFLVSEEARHINGQQIVLDGGWTKSAWWGNYAEG